MTPPEKIKRKLLMPDTDGDAPTDRNNTICPFHYFSIAGGGGHKNQSLGFIGTLHITAIYFAVLRTSLARLCLEKCD